MSPLSLQHSDMARTYKYSHLYIWCCQVDIWGYTAPINILIATEIRLSAASTTLRCEETSGTAMHWLLANADVFLVCLFASKFQC